MAGKNKTLEEYQIQDIAKSVIEEYLPNLITRGEYDKQSLIIDNKLASQQKEIGSLQKAEEERLKDRKTYRFQISGIIIGFVFQFIVWAIIASNGFKVGER